MPQLNIPEIVLNAELKNCKNMEDLVGKNGLMQRLFGNIIQQFLEADMEEHLGRDKYDRFSDDDKNYRNGYSPKKIKTSFGEADINVPRDRKAEWWGRNLFSHNVLLYIFYWCSDIKSRAFQRMITCFFAQASISAISYLMLSTSNKNLHMKGFHFRTVACFCDAQFSCNIKITINFHINIINNLTKYLQKIYLDICNSWMYFSSGYYFDSRYIVLSIKPFS